MYSHDQVILGCSIKKKGKEYLRWTGPGDVGGVVLRRGRAKWVLESRRASEQLSAEGKFHFNASLGTVSPLWMSRKRLPGRHCPFINFDQIFTVHHMACLTSHSRFSRPGFEPFGAICVPFGWTPATSHSAGPCWCLWDPAT